MRRDINGDFLHPGLEADDPLRPHVLYRLSRAGRGLNSIYTSWW